MTEIETRHAELRTMLNTRRRELRDEVKARIRDGRIDRSRDGGDDLEHSDADTQGDLGLTLLQMRTAMLARIEQAIARLDLGKYGSCVECEEEISEKRLRAMPFAVRCQACEKQRENEQAQGGQPQRVSLFRDAVGF